MFGDLRRVGGGPGSWVGRRAIAIWAPFSIQATVFVRGMGYVALARSLAAASTALRTTTMAATISPRFVNDDCAAATTSFYGGGGCSFLCAEERSRMEYSADMLDALRRLLHVRLDRQLN